MFDIAWLRSVASSLLGAILCACSTGPYKDQVTAFDGALSTAQAAFTSLENQQATAAAVRQVSQAATRGKFLTVTSCDLTKSPKKDPKNCALMLGGTEPLKIKTNAPQGHVLMTAFVDYGDGLAKLVAAKDITDLNTGITKVNSSVGSLAKSLGGTAAFVPYVGPALDLLAFAFNQYLEARRVEALKNAIISAESVVELAVPELAKEARVLQKNAFQDRNTQLQQRVDAVVDAGRDWSGSTNELTEESIQGYAALKNLAELDAGAAFEQLGVAHKKLVEAARSPQFSLQDAETAILAFGQKAEALYVAAQPQAAPTKSAPSKPTKK
jgi:uncharacterized phage infection (PIP) family protein YhgE